MSKRTPFLWPSPKPGEKTYWRSLDELSQTKEFREYVEREFPQGASELSHPISRRSFMHLMGASMALAGLASCRRPEEKILPYSKQPENTVLGIPKYYATAMGLGKQILGLLVESNEGRPTKIEGNPDHPSSLGSTNTFAQAAILDLYDPDRSQTPLSQGKAIDTSTLVAQLTQLHKSLTKNQGQGFSIISGYIHSPVLLSLRSELLQKFPKSTWHVWEPVNDDNAREGSRIAFGQDYYEQIQLEQAKVIVSIDADFLGTGPDSVRNARLFAKRRIPHPLGLNRLYSIESAWTITGTSADHRLCLRPSEILKAVIQLAVLLQGHGVAIDLPVSWKSMASKEHTPSQFLSALAKDLVESKEQGVLLMAGESQPKEIHALLHVINQALRAGGTIASTSVYYPSMDTDLSLCRESIRELADRLGQGQVETLLVLDSNPAYTAPADLAFQEKMKKVKHLIHLGLYQDETGSLAHTHIPMAHFLEAWGDVVSYDGTTSIVQPLIAPLYQGWSSIEVLSLLLTGVKSSGHDVIKNFWVGILQGINKQTLSNQPSDAAKAKESPDLKHPEQLLWHRSLKAGLLKLHGESWESPLKAPSVAPSLQKEKVSQALAAFRLPQSTRLEIILPPDYSVYDGRFANNGWLQELPDPITKLVWDNAALLSPKTAKALGVANDDLIKIESGGRSVEAAVHVVPGHAEDTIQLNLGYGRNVVGRIGQGAGFNAYALRTSAVLQQGFGEGNVTALGKKYDDPRDKNWIDIVHVSGLASTQDHFSMEGRDIVQELTAKEVEQGKGSHKPHVPLKALWERPREFTEGQQWGMAIDLSKCIGCGACTIACQSENNIPLVGKAQVRKGREMHWIRVDRYFSGEHEGDGPIEAVHQPVPCMHCENAPCENVCPVAATLHSPDGLNDMAYNRCIGTRYCSNNCPYKVRRFNFLDWRGDVKEVEKLKYNPDVTLRSRGVMEKCTYCVQRIRGAQQDAKKHGDTHVADGKVTPACAQACPADAIVFGDIRDASSRVSQLKRDQRNYDLLGELNTKPRTSYLSRVRNPNPLLETSKKEASHHE